MSNLTKVLASGVFVVLMTAIALPLTARADDDTTQDTSTYQEQNQKAEDTDAKAVDEATTRPDKALDDVGDAVVTGTDADRAEGHRK